MDIPYPWDVHAYPMDIRGYPWILFIYKDIHRYPFDIHGSDERQYSSQGFRINVATISKDKYYEYVGEDPLTSGEIVTLHVKYLGRNVRGYTPNLYYFDVYDYKVDLLYVASYDKNFELYYVNYLIVAEV